MMETISKRGKSVWGEFTIDKIIWQICVVKCAQCRAINAEGLIVNTGVSIIGLGDGP